MMNTFFESEDSDIFLPDVSVKGWLLAFKDVDEVQQVRVIQRLEAEVRAFLKKQALSSEEKIRKVIELLFALTKSAHENVCLTLLLDCSFYYSRIGRSPYGRILVEKLVGEFIPKDDLRTFRRAHNLLAVMQLDAADFQASLSHLESALSYAYKLNDPLQIAPCLANAAAALMEMGHYHDAIKISLSITKLDIDNSMIRILRFQSATNGLFCAHRTQDAQQALDFLTIGNSLVDSPGPDHLMKATYEYNRALYLIDTFDHETAEELIQAATKNIGQTRNPRVEILLKIPEALCEWARRDEAGYASSRKKLRELYEVTKKSRLYHDDVLRALMKVHGNAIDHEAAKLGMRYAKELVEYTTSVKRAKFYRQLSDRGVDLDPTPPKLEFPFDPFANVRQWLAPANDDLPEGKPADEIHGPASYKRQVAKHEELAAIHEDLAKLRTDAILKEIRSVAYDTAENWALAAEFFDDQTGQHCFRVGHLAGMLAREIGMEGPYCARIEHAARLHDIGKIGINEMILLKPGPLDPSELTAMRAHAEVGAFMLQGAKDPVLQMAAVIAKHHHEWWNGAGYPSSLSDRRIPLAARICALADVYDALTHARPYKGAWPHRVAVEEMLNLSGVQFDPHLIRPFLRVLERYVPALAEGRIPGLDHLKTNGLIASRKKLMETISGSQP
jgi:putative two-component system response regulator